MNKYLELQDKLCQAMEMFAENAINKAGFDRTIQATVMDCTDESIGQYKVRYQDSIFYAYAQNVEDKYSIGSGVYILIQNNDMSKDKFIIGAVDKLGKDYITITDESERYEMIGSNCIKNTSEIQLCSYETGTYKTEDIISINNSDLLTYCEKADYLAVKMNVRTSLDREQRARGNYGLKFTLSFNNKENPTQDKEEIHIININSMIGNPYNYINPTSQFFALELDMKNFKGIKEIVAFCEKFPKQKEGMPNDIFITDLEVYAANQMTEEELMSPHLKFFAPRGTIFNMDDLPITAYGRVDGQDINKGEFFWFVEDNTIDIDSPDYLPIGGKGWKSKNNFDIIEGEEEEKEVIPFETGYQLFEINKHLAKYTTYKCAMRYNGMVLSKEITLYNKNSTYSISIESSGGEKFYNDIGETTLTCKALKDDIPVSNCIYKWMSINENNYMTKLQNNTSEVSLSASSINRFIKYKCMVYIKMDGEEVLVGSDEITLTNSLEVEGTYHLVINNGSQSFIYNEEGISPANKNLENPMTILPLGFILYDNQGKEIPREKISKENIEWKVPAFNSLLQLADVTAEEDYYYVNEYDLHFGIRSTYSVNAADNQVELTVKYQDLVLKAYTNLIFTKEGDIGSNGTGIFVRIRAVEEENLFLQKEEPMMYYNKANRIYYKNYEKLQAIIVEGDQMPASFDETANDTNCVWSILQNRINVSSFDNTHLNYNLGIGFSQKTYSSNLELVDVIANVISAKIKYNNLQFFTAFPMITAFIRNDTYIPYVRKNTGFRSIQYSSDGLYPKYNNALPFTIGIKNSNGEDVDVSSFRFRWGTNTTKTGENTFKYRPKDRYDGRAVNESLICTIYNSSGTQIAKLFIPIYMYLNTYGYSALNDWNGNSIEIDNEGGYILTPQVGAGEKNASNQFTGLLMGRMVDSDKNEKVGLIGLYNGVQTIFLDSKTGRAEFGKSGVGQIILDPSTNEAIIQSGNFSTTAKTGMQINLSNPSIIFGSGNFSVNSAGKLKATDVDISGKITASEGYIGDKINGFTIDSKYISNGTVTNVYQTTGKGIYIGTDGINISNGTANTTSYITKDIVHFGDGFHWDNTSSTLNITGHISGSSISGGSIEGASITGSYIEGSIVRGGRITTSIPLWEGENYSRGQIILEDGYLGLFDNSPEGIWGGSYIHIEHAANQEVLQISSYGISFIRPQENLHYYYLRKDGVLLNPESGGIGLYCPESIVLSTTKEGESLHEYIGLERDYGIFIDSWNGDLTLTANADSSLIIQNFDSVKFFGAGKVYYDMQQLYFHELGNPYSERASSSTANARFCDPSSNSEWSRFARTGSSSKRYKNIQRFVNFEDIKSLFSIKTYWFTYKEKYLHPEDERLNKLIPGFIVEDWEDIMPIAIDHKSDGTPEMWNNQIVTPLIFEMIKYNHEEINNLKQQVQQLQAKLDNI